MFRSLIQFFGRSNADDSMVGDWFLNDRFEAFLADPSPENYLKVRVLVLGDKDYRASSTELDDLALLFDQGPHADIPWRVRRMMPVWLLSPGTHRLAAKVARILRDEEGERRELLIYERSIDGILGTGDGSRENPYFVTHINDEYDIIDHFEKKVARQSVTPEEGRVLDQVVCQDESEFWFDVTDVHKRMDDPPRLSRARRGSRAGRVR